MSKEDKAIAHELVQAELAETMKTMLGLKTEMVVASYSGDGALDNTPPSADGGDGTLIPIHIGARGQLSKAKARGAGNAWREIVRRYPKAFFVFALLGYDEDPRPIWEIPEAARYVRWWAHYAGLDDFEVANRLIGEDSATAQLGLGASGSNIGLLAACGVFGPEAQQQIIGGFAPTQSN